MIKIVERIIFDAWALIELIVNLLAIAPKFRAGINTQVMSFARVFPAVFGRMFVFLKINPIAMQQNNVSIGVNAAKKVLDI